MKKTIHAYKNTTSQAGLPVQYEIETSDVVALKSWTNYYGNPSFVYHMDNGDTYFLVDDYSGTNGLGHLHRVTCKRKKDMFVRF